MPQSYSFGVSLLHTRLKSGQIAMMTFDDNAVVRMMEQTNKNDEKTVVKTVSLLCEFCDGKAIVFQDIDLGGSTCFEPLFVHLQTLVATATQIWSDNIQQLGSLVPTSSNARPNPFQTQANSIATAELVNQFGLYSFDL